MKAALILVMAAIAGAAYYLVRCWWFPLAACWRCGGAGRFRSKNRKTWRRCRRCGGSGERFRVGRRLWTYWTNAREKGNR